MLVKKRKSKKLSYHATKKLEYRQHGYMYLRYKMPMPLFGPLLYYIYIDNIYITTVKGDIPALL